jgi:hypothetical protein
MRILLHSIWALSLLFLTGCEYFKRNEDKAIELVQQTKKPVDKTLMALIFAESGLINKEQTWLEVANEIAKNDANTNYKWQAAKSNVNNELYVVSFTDENGWGQRWEANLKEKIVKHINSNEFLVKRYGLNRLDTDESFKVTFTKSEAFKIRKANHSYSNPGDKEVFYIFKGKVVNKTDKVITNALIKGYLKLIFQDKTIEGSSSNFETGFIKDVTKSNPWKPNTEKEIHIATEGVDYIYTSYIPEYVSFEINLSANDPIGYSYDKLILDKELKNEWKALKIK